MTDIVERLRNEASIWISSRTSYDLLNDAIAEIERLRAASEWRDISTAPQVKWIIGYTSWGQYAGNFNEWVGPCEWVKDHFEFVNTDFDVFPRPTHYIPLPAPPQRNEDPRG